MAEWSTLTDALCNFYAWYDEGMDAPEEGITADMLADLSNRARMVNLRDMFARSRGIPSYLD